MPVARPPLQVEVVTKIPANLGSLGLTDPGVTGGISRTAATAQSTAARAAVEVVTDVPGQIRNITPITVGQRAAQLGKIGVQLGSKVVGVGLGVLGNLAQDLLFPEPVGAGSDMINGVKIGSQPKSAPITTPVTTTQAIAKPNVNTQPFKPPVPVVAPVAAPTKPKPQTQTTPQSQTETQPLPSPTSTRPQSAPVQIQSKPISITTPAPRSALETPVVTRPKPLNTESPFPLNIVDLNSYGGVNLTYPIAQKLTGLTEEISELLRPNFDQIRLKINEIPQTLEQILKNAKIETTVNLPAKIDLTSQLPFKVDLSKQVPVAVDLSKQIPVALDLSKQVPVNLDVTSQLPVKVDLSKQIPIAVDLSKQIPVTTDLTSQLPVSVNLDSQIPFQLDLSKQVPITVDLTKQVPITVDLTKSIPITVDLTKKIPVAVDVSAALQPDPKASGLNSLQECCESIQKILKKEAEKFEGRGELICGDGTIPFSYSGQGLNGIHQLIKIVLGANQQILEKICNLNIEYPLIEGSGVYDCGTFPPTLYYYSGLGFLGIQNQVEQLFKLDKQILAEVCDIDSSPFGSSPDISGQIEYFDCDRTSQIILYSGNGLQGLSNQVNALTTVVKTAVQAACDSGSIVVMPDARYEHFKAVRQLKITWGTRYPTQQGSLWDSYLPNPLPNLNWCDHFEQLQVTKGNVKGHVEWENSKIPTGIYCETEEEARRILLYLVTLSAAIPTLDASGQPKIVIIKGNSSKRIIQERTLRAVRVAISEIGEDGNVSSVQCFTPPLEGCFPTMI